MLIFGTRTCTRHPKKSTQHPFKITGVLRSGESWPESQIPPNFAWSKILPQLAHTSNLSPFRSLVRPQRPCKVSTWKQPYVPYKVPFRKSNFVRSTGIEKRTNAQGFVHFREIFSFFENFEKLAQKWLKMACSDFLSSFDTNDHAQRRKMTGIIPTKSDNLVSSFPDHTEFSLEPYQSVNDCNLLLCSSYNFLDLELWV